MALRLNELVVCGELFNVRKNSVHGQLVLRGFDRPLLLELTGNCCPDLAGRHIRFEVRSPIEDDAHDSSETESDRLKRLNLNGLAWQQVGPTGTMTAARKVRVADCPPEELCARCKLDEPPPMEWKACLYLEWFGQNGRVVLELADPILEFIGADAKTAETSPGDSDQPTSSEQAGDAVEGGLSVTSIRLTDDGEIDICDETPSIDDEDDCAEAADESYGLIPVELQREFDARARELDRTVSDNGEEAEFIRELELMDDLMERGQGEPLDLLFDDVVKLPSPKDLNDEQAEHALKSLLARLALFGIALDVCEHFTPLQAYQLLVEDLCRKECAFPQLRGTGWVQHFSTWESCEACQAEFDREHENR